MENSINETHTIEDPTACINIAQDTPEEQRTKLPPNHKSATGTKVGLTTMETLQTTQTKPHHNPLEGEITDDNYHDPHRCRSNPTTRPPDANKTPSGTWDPHALLNKVVTIVDVREHAPKSGRRHHPINGTTTPNEVNDPYTLTNNALEIDDTGMSDVVTSNNPSLKMRSTLSRSTNNNSGEYTFTTRHPQAHRLEAPERPHQKPPDQS